VWGYPIIGDVKSWDETFHANNISFGRLENGSYVFLPDSSLDLFKGRLAVQDYSTGSAIGELQVTQGEKWWDCCAGAGGKSLKLKSFFPDLEIWVSDIRASILDQLSSRFSQAAITNYKILRADVSRNIPEKLPVFDGIIADVPCSGSGTWSRAPEHLSFFNNTEIIKFSEVQFNILNNVWQHLKPGGTLIYITCSVFEMENEMVINKFIEKRNASVTRQHYIDGYRMGAENIFVCHLRKEQ
ncbi:MAG: RsmB/NOP family class I SAM-dependent RNA methyltransferase, partial [Bacteroidota bacterium]|nr:RsmB/NOP family class I SAM-dependent RNA methyltransferase [Bacteroidota bacterium]